MRFRLMPGHRFDSIAVAPLIDGVEFGAFIADKAFDSNDIVAILRGEPKPLPNLPCAGCVRCKCDRP